MPNRNTAVVEALIEAAKTHGEYSEPDHEVGDLQDYLRAAFSLLTPEQVGQLVHLESVHQTYYGTDGEELDAASLLSQLDEVEIEAPVATLDEVDTSDAGDPACPKGSVMLFRAIHAAHHFYVNEYEIDHIDYRPNDPSMLEVECGEDNAWAFRDQVIEIDELGYADGTDINGNEVTLEFRMQRPMTLIDIENQ